MAISKRQAVHWLFDLAVVFKAIDGTLEIVGGYFLVFRPGWIGPAALTWAATLLLHDPASQFGHILMRWGGGLTLDTEHFASTYLIAHGAAKVFIAWGLIREKLWAFPTALVVFGLLILYQLYRLAHTHSPTLAVLIALDVAVCYLIWREYRFRRNDERTPRQVRESTSASA
jgi:uncharacterized membrane protein